VSSSRKIKFETSASSWPIHTCRLQTLAVESRVAKRRIYFLIQQFYYFVSFRGEGGHYNVTFPDG